MHRTQKKQLLDDLPDELPADTSEVVIPVNRFAWVTYMNISTKISFNDEIVKDIDDFKKEINDQLQLDTIHGLIIFKNSRGQVIDMKEDQPLPTWFEDQKNAIHIELGGFSEKPEQQQVEKHEGLVFQSKRDAYESHRDQVDRPLLPTLQELIDSVQLEPSETGPIYSVGQWVEYLTVSMQWKLSYIKDRVRKDTNVSSWKSVHQIYFYSVGTESMVPEWKIRCSEQGLSAIFGRRPWLWQQYAMLKLERLLQFDRTDQLDFKKLACQQYGHEWFKDWLNDDKNMDFKAHYKRQTVYAQHGLLTHILSPFQRIDYVTHSSSGHDWTLHNNLSLYTYVSILGTGWISLIACFCVQMVAPMILMNLSIRNPPRFKDRHVKLEFSMSSLCSKTGTHEGKFLTMAMFLVYFLKIVPDTMATFRDFAGHVGTTSSRISSLRQIIWERDDDNLFQKIGFKIDEYMNTGYNAALYLTNLFILFLTNSVPDIMWNALAVEFIVLLDEEATESDMWDFDGRWLQAGVIELIIRSTLRLEWLGSPEIICEKFNIDDKVHTVPVMKDKKRADEDSKDENYLPFPSAFTHKKPAEQLASVNTNPKNFGIISRTLQAIGLINSGVFHRFCEYRVWSNWEKILYLAPVPSLTKTPSYRTNTLHGSSASGEFSPLLSTRRYKRIGVVISPHDDTSFSRRIWNVLNLKELFRELRVSCGTCNPFKVVSALIGGLIEWFLYILLVSFPFLVFAGLIFTASCY